MRDRLVGGRRDLAAQALGGSKRGVHVPLRATSPSTSSAARARASASATQSATSPLREVGRGREAMSGMLMPCAAERRGRARRSTPGRLGTDDAQLAQRCRRCSAGLQQRRGARRAASPARRSSAAPSPAAQRARASASRAIVVVERRRASASRLARRSPRHSGGLAPATRVASRKLGPSAAIASPPSARAAWATSDVGDDVRQVRDRGHEAVVVGGVDRGRAARRGRRRSGAGARAGCPRSSARRREVPGGAVEEVGAGVLDARGLGARQRVAADEALVAVARRPARAWSSRRRSPRSPAARRRAPRRPSRAQRADGHGDERDVGAVERLGEVVDGHVDRAALQRRPLGASGSQPRTVRAEPLARGQADRARR